MAELRISSLRLKDISESQVRAAASLALEELRHDVTSAIEEQLTPIIERELDTDRTETSREVVDERWY